MFLSDPRTTRISAEPKASNFAVLNIGRGSGMHIETVSALNQSQRAPNNCTL